MKFKTLQIYEKWRLLPNTGKLVFALLVLSCLIGSAEATANTTNPATNTIPAVPLDTIFSELYVLSAGWLKWVVLLVIVFGGICYAASKSEESRANGASYIKNAVLAVVSVMVGIWIVNWLYTLS